MRVPYFIERLTGFNMNYYYAQNVPSNLLTYDTRQHMKEGATEEIKAKVFKGTIEIDDPIDIYSKHTILHDAVVLNREELFEFMI
jgi:hypothetical protein